MSEIRVDKIQAYQDSFSVTIAGITTFSGTGCVSMPGGTSTQRPEVAKKGQLRYINGDVKKGLEYYNGTDWITLGESYIDINAVRSGLVLYLDAGNVKSYSGSGETWFDLSSNSNHGTLINGVGYSSSGGGSLVFDGVDDYVSVPISNFFTSYSQQITIETWGYIPSSATWSNGNRGNIIARGNFAGSHGLWRTTTNNQVSAFFRQSGDTFGSVESTGTIGRDAWYQLVAVWTGSGSQLYINGSLTNSNSGSLGDTQSNIAFEIGRNTAASGSSGNYFTGNQTGTKIYNRALTASEISQNFNAFRDRFGI